MVGRRRSEGTGNDGIRLVPGPLAGEEWLLLGHPSTQIPECPRSSRLPDPGQAPAFGFPLIGLHLDQRIDQALLRGASPNSLDDSACWHSRFG
jgi:hypothetical protein